MSAPPLKGNKLACAGKRRHPDEATARAMAMHSIQAHGDVTLLYVYRCPACHGWHLTRRRQGAAVTVSDPFAERRL